jgi:hypothetical protein
MDTTDIAVNDPELIRHQLLLENVRLAIISLRDENNDMRSEVCRALLETIDLYANNVHSAERFGLERYRCFLTTHQRTLEDLMLCAGFLTAY